jgi:hypothetical protein
MLLVAATQAVATARDAGLSLLPDLCVELAIFCLSKSTANFISVCSQWHLSLPPSQGNRMNDDVV